MIKRNKGMLILTSIVMLLPVVVGLLLWDKLPEQIPIHWNVSGEVDGWGSRATAVFFLPLFILAIHWICVFATCADPKAWDVHEKVLTLVLWICPFVSLLVNTFVFATALGYKLAIEIIMPLAFGILFMILGNLMPKCKRNYTVGIRLPWTLNDDENWNRTHRFSGKIWVVGGAVIAATSVFSSFVLFLTVVVLIAVLPVLYSYLLYRRTLK